ncbi:TPA: MFS transporter, partial [Salmonella enterica]
KFVPKNELTVSEGESKNKKALIGLIDVIKMPTIWLSAITSLTVYWIYITLIYTVPYLQAVFNITTTQAAIFGIINTGAMGVIAGLVAGSIADFFFKSSIKMMCCSLCLTAVSLVCTIFLPKSHGMLLINIILLACFSFSIFLAKGIILAPIAEVGVPKEYSGSAMSIGSFAAYASVFWAYALNGWIIDHHPPIVAYEMIFAIGLSVSVIGILCSTSLIIMKNKNSTSND